MATIEETIYARLSGFAALTALVGTRIYPNIREQDAALPSVDYRRVSSVRYSAMHADSGVVSARFQLDVWAATYASAIAVAAQVRAAMQRYSTTGVFDTFIINETDLYESDSRQHHIAIDIEIHYSE